MVAEAVHCGSLPIDQQVFQDYTEELQKIDPRTGTTNMQIQYEVILAYFSLLNLLSVPVTLIYYCYAAKR